MQFSAIQRLTLLDYPGHTACTVFTPGCNFRCHYCHNSEFVLPEKLKKIQKNFIPEEAIFSFLEKRKKLLEGVCVTGGEPTIHKKLPEFLKKIKKMGFKIKLDTNGSHPQMLQKILDEKLVDYVAMDVKSNAKRKMQNEKFVDSFCGVPMNASKLKKSQDILMDSEIDYEFRTTLVKEFHTNEEYKNILKNIKGAKRYSLQNFRSTGGCLNPHWEKYSGFSKNELQEKNNSQKNM